MEDEITDKQLDQCFEVTMEVGRILKGLGHQPRSCIVVAAMLIRQASKAGRAFEAADAIKELLLYLEKRDLS